MLLQSMGTAMLTNHKPSLQFTLPPAYVKMVNPGEGYAILAYKASLVSAIGGSLIEDEAKVLSREREFCNEKERERFRVCVRERERERSQTFEPDAINIMVRVHPCRLVMNRARLRR